MEIIRELVDFVSRNKLKSIKLLGQAERGPVSMVNSLYFKIASGEFSSDEEAATYYFGASPGDHAYRKLKNQLKNRLINALFFVDAQQAGYSDWDRAYISCCKEWAAVKILLNRGANFAAVDLAHKIFKRAEHYQFSELLVNISKILRLYYATREPDAHKLRYYDRLHTQYVQLWQSENLAEDLYIRLVHRHLFARDKTNPLHVPARTFFEQLRPLMEVHRSYHFLRHAYLLKVAAGMEEGDYPATLQACDEAVQVLGKIEFVPRPALLTFLYQKLLCFIQLKDYAAGLPIVVETLQLEKPGTFNWFKNRELHLLLAMHSQQYAETWTIWVEVTQHPGFSGLHKRTREQWKIYEACLHYLMFIGLLEAPAFAPGKFRVHKFLNEVPTFSKDKRGQNIPILILHILFLIAQKRYDEVLTRMEAIERYCSRYLRKDEQFRSNVFVRLLLQIPKAHFHPQTVLPRAQRYLKLLQDHPLRLSPQGHEIELIPFEELWKMVWSSLGRKMKQVEGR